MQIYANQLEAQLKRALAPIYLLSGDEPLLLEECCAAIRRAAQAQGCAERQVLTVEPGFDWNGLYASTQSLSLFAERRLIELRLPTGKPGEAGAKFLTQMAAAPPPDIVLLIVAGKLDKQARAAKWVQALEGAGVAVTVYPVEAEQLPAWITQRMSRHGLKPGPGVAELLAHHMEGNLLAAAQEIEKLALLLGRGEVSLDDIEGNLGDNARFSVFTLADACLRGGAAAILRILNSLRAEGVEPVLVLWALAREARSLAQMSFQVAAGRAVAQVLEAQRVWARRRPLVGNALARGRPGYWHALLSRAARTDRVIKGRLPGDAWRELQCLALALGGVKVSSCGFRV